MKVEIKIPSVGESITEVTIAQILKESGSYVRQDEEILEIETDKVNQMVYAPADGALTLSVKPDDTVKVGASIGSIETDAEKPQGESPKKEESASKQETPSAPPTDGARKSEESYVQELTPQKKEEAPAPEPIQKEAAPSKEGRGERRERMTKLRKIIATKLVEVKNQTALLTTFNEVDMSNVMRVRKDVQDKFTKKHGVKLGFMSFFVKATVSALQKYPLINARIDGEEVVYRDYCDVGIAVGTEKGLMVPVLRNAEKMTYAEIEQKIKEYSGKARSGKISPDDLQGGTFTISNGGVYGSMLSTPILNPPQSGILGMHNILERPVAIEGKVEIRPMMYLALSYDHRIVDGKESIEFLVHIKKALEDPTKALLDI